MKDKVYKLIELTGTSTKSIEDAVNTALKRAGKTIQNLGWFQIVETRGSIEKNQVEHWQVTIKVGFTVDRQYKKSSEASPLWIGSDPVECQWSMYTAAWSSTVLSRDEKDMFQQMYLDSSVQGLSVFQANVSDPAFKKVGDETAWDILFSSASPDVVAAGIPKKSAKTAS